MKNSLLTAKRMDHSLSAGKIHRRSRIDHHMKIVPSKNKPPFLSSPDRSGNPFCFSFGFGDGKTKRLQRRAGPPFGEETTLLLLNF